jgi:hypothetical protein
MCFRDDDERDDLGRSDPARADEVDGRDVTTDTDWLPIGEVVSGLLRGWRLDDE